MEAAVGILGWGGQIITVLKSNEGLPILDQL